MPVLKLALKMIKLLHNNSCSKSRDVFNYLNENNIGYELIDMVNEPLSVVEIQTVLHKLGIGIRDLIRTNEKVFVENYEGRDLSDDELLHLLEKHPELIQRPIVIKGSKAVIGRPLEKVKEFVEI